MLKRLSRWLRAQWNRLLSRRLLAPYLISFTALISAAVLLFSAWFSLSIHSRLRQNIYQSASNQTRQSAGVLANTFRDLDSLTVKLNNLGTILPSAFERNPLEAYRALSHYDYTSLKYDDMAMFYPQEPVVLLSVHGTVDADIYFSAVPQRQALLDAISACREPTLISTGKYGASRTQSLLLYVQPLPSRSHTPRYAALFVIRYTTLQNQLLSGQSSTSSLCALTDASGEVLWCNSDALARHLRQSNLSTEQTVQLEGQSYLCTACDVNGLAQLVALERVTSQFDEVNRVVISLIVLCAAFIIFAGTIATWSIVRGYLPINRIVRAYRQKYPEGTENDKTDLATLNLLARHYGELMQQQANRDEFSQNQLQDMFVMSAVQGKHISPPELENFRRNLGIDFTRGEHFACLVLFDEMPGETQQAALRAVLQQNGGTFHGCMSMLSAYKTALCLINMPLASATARAQAAGQLLKACAQPHATVAVGGVCAGLNDIGRSYIEARAALDYRLIRGRGTVILFDELPDESTSRREYPTALLREYTASLKSWDAQKISEQMNRILNHIYAHQLGLQVSRCICYELTSAFFREMRELHSGTAFDQEALDVFSISEYESVRELMENIRQFSARIRKYLDTFSDTENNAFVLRCRQIMEANLSNPQFSLEQVAEQFRITPQTLRRRFKQATGMTLISAMTEMRIARAKELLVNTDLDIRDILAQAGYFDASSFTRLFRAATGMSPRQYREAARAGNPPQPPSAAD